MKKMIAKYIEYLRYEKNYSSHTEISYLKDLHQFVDFIDEQHSGVDVNDIDSDLIRLWVVDLMKNKISARSANRKLSALKSFFTYLLKKRLIASNPASRVVGPRMTKPMPAFVSDKEMNALLDFGELYDGDGCFVDFRNMLIVELFYVTGIRRAELIGLRDVDVDFSARTICVTGKRNKQRLIPISDDMCCRMKKYMSIRDSEVESVSGSLFVRETGEPLYPALVYRIVTELLSTIPTLAKTSPHVLRHTFATSMLNNGADINAVKELLGHSSLAATEVYTHTSFEELKNIYNKAHSRA